MARSSQSGPRGNTPGPVPNPDQLRELQRKSDRSTAIALFVIGLFATVFNMTGVTEQALVSNAAEFFRANNLGDYHRPAELAPISWVGVIGYVVNYAAWLYLALVRYRAGKQATWCAFVGALIALLFGTIIGVLSLAAHPQIIDFATQSMMSGTAPTP